MELREKIAREIKDCRSEEGMEISLYRFVDKILALCPQCKAPMVTISEIKLYRPENDVAFHNELMDLLDLYLDEYRIDWDMELPQPPKEN